MVTKVLVIVMAVILFLLLITSLSFTLSARWHTKNTQHRLSSHIEIILMLMVIVNTTTTIMITFDTQHRSF